MIRQCSAWPVIYMPWRFIKQAFRVLKHNGRIFHYIGDPESKSGARVTGGVIRRLQEAGFKRVTRAPRAFGVVAHKE